MTTKRSRWTVAAIQMTSTDDRARNMTAATKLARLAAAEGADLIALPENFSYLRPEGSPIGVSDRLDGELVAGLEDLARELGCYVLAGSIPERIPRSRRVHNTSLLLGPDGRRLAVYRKIHLFDIRIRGRVSFMESRRVAAGDRPVVADTPLGRLGLSVCYDLRFPELYRQLALRGAEVLFVPSAFTSYTGRFHWLPLLRARAIENQCWVVAPAQVGRHGPGRRSYGHTAIIDPWGTVVGLRERGAGVVTATIDLAKVRRVRSGLPALEHVRRELFRAPPGSRRRG
jgi:predicted amidohydrolase